MLNYFLAPFQTSALSPVAALVLAAVAVIILGISKSGFGGSVGILAVPLFAFALGPKNGTALLLPFLLAADIFSVFHYWRAWDSRILKVLAPGTLAGILIGAVILYLLIPHGAASGPPNASSARDASANALNLLTGIICVAYIALDQVRQRFAPHWHFRANFRSGSAAGLAVGTVSTLSNAAGPIAAIFLLGQDLPRQTFMGTTVIYFFAVNATKLLAFSLIGMYNAPQLQSAPWFLFALVPVGTLLGARLNKSISDRAFRTTILLLVLLSGLDLIASSTTGFSLLSLLRSAH